MIDYVIEGSFVELMVNGNVIFLDKYGVNFMFIICLINFVG